MEIVEFRYSIQRDPDSDAGSVQLIDENGTGIKAPELLPVLSTWLRGAKHVSGGRPASDAEACVTSEVGSTTERETSVVRAVEPKDPRKKRAAKSAETTEAIAETAGKKKGGRKATVKKASSSGKPAERLTDTELKARVANGELTREEAIVQQRTIRAEAKGTAKGQNGKSKRQTVNA
jgi:hypothetical protein